MLERLTLPSFALLTPQELADWIKIDTNSDIDTTSLLLESATDYVEGLTGLAIGLASYRYTAPNYSGNLVALPIAPVQSITSVTVTTGTTATPVAYRQSGRSLALDAFQRGDLLTVELKAGYSTLASVPVALRHAIAVLVSASYNNREALDPSTLTTVANLCARYRRYA